MTQRKLLFASGATGLVLGALALAVSLLLWNDGFAALFSFKNELYSGHTIVTGQRDETRIPGFLAALLDVAKKVSGDHMLTAAQIESITHGNVKIYVKSFHDHDRMEDIPIHDEQGTRDRSFDLFVDFVPNKVDALLRVLGRKPWSINRPKILVLLRVQNATGAYLLTGDEDDENGTEQREAFMNSAWQAGLPLTLPTPAILTAAKLNETNIDLVTPKQIVGLAQATGTDVVIIGHLIWVGGSGGWKADWAFEDTKGQHHWQIEGTNFDGAFRNAMRGVAQILSSHGEPSPNLN